MEQVWIIGAGQFGARAVAAAGRRVPAVDITLVDSDVHKLQGWPPAVHTVCGDGIAFVARRLARGEIPAMIVPAAPIHIAYAWIRRALEGQTAMIPRPVPDVFAAQLPNPIRGADGELYISHADFLCPPDCIEPARRCSATGRERGLDLFRLLGQLEVDGYTPVVVRSRQLAPGVGGYLPQALFAARTAVAHLNGPVLLATACRCHGVVHAALVHPLNLNARQPSTST